MELMPVRCPVCGQLLMRAAHVEGEIKCPRCKRVVKVSQPQGGDKEKR